ncbi:MAG: DUF924 family protein [Hyphomicrobiaceae bacterium]
MAADTITAINNFWLGNSLATPREAFARRDWWYKGGSNLDNEIRDRFGHLVEQACCGHLTSWKASPHGAIALILLLDQFTRNTYRHSPNAYRGDGLALTIVKEVIAQGLDTRMHPVERIWLYHPFHHCELLSEQDYGMSLLHDVREAALPTWRLYVERSIGGWKRHRDIVARFGRFPHRNEILGRTNTADEAAFLATNGEAFGQGRK